MRARTLVLLGLGVGSVAVLGWFLTRTNATRQRLPEPIAIAETVPRGDLAPDDKGTATERTAAPLPAPPAAGKQPSTIVSPAASVEPDAAARRTRQVAEIAAEKTVPTAGDSRTLTAEQILRAMRESYARLGSYSDRGRLTRMWHEANLVYVDVAFRTFFKRPQLYRFEWLGESAPYRESYWSNPTGLLVRKGNGTPSRHASFARIFPYPEISVPYSVPYHVLHLLAPDATPPDRRFLVDAARLADETIDGVDCFHLSGTAGTRNLERHLWIGQDDFLLRRIRTVAPHAYDLSLTLRYGSGTETVQIDYLDVTTDLNLPDELFYPAAATSPGGN